MQFFREKDINKCVLLASSRNPDMLFSPLARSSNVYTELRRGRERNMVMRNEETMTAGTEFRKVESGASIHSENSLFPGWLEHSGSFA
ncbi:hypothetical protein CEXT_47141 [Caerostris extrusa]|uniref:Ycf15 n=1 Tax=Caerostris extrusa TaxID=172846 RepID=A0AAV4P5S0_CAEEX|nr:hypothetical protein CEXT_47141 [Caerostris extrusa]